MLPKHAREPHTKHLKPTQAHLDYWAGYFDARHKETIAPRSKLIRFKLESELQGHLNMLRLIHYRREARKISRYDSAGTEKESWFRFTINERPHGTLTKHYLRGWYDARFKVIYSSDRKEIQLTGLPHSIDDFRHAYYKVIGVKPVFKQYHSDSEAVRFKLTGHAVDLFLAAIFDESCFNPQRWPKFYLKFYKSYSQRKLNKID